MSELKRPGVYVEEVPKLPPSVAQVETAIPTFIGYTDQAVDKGNTLHLIPKKITSLVEYEAYFGKAKKESIQLQDTLEKGLTLIKPDAKFLMYYSLQMYFANGGGPCYIVSVGNYSGEVNKNELKQGLDASVLEDDSTLVVFPDATSLSDEMQFYALYQDALSQVNMLKNRFVILDTYLGNSTTKKDLNGTPANTIEFLRNKIGTTPHAAAYFPHLKTVLNYTFDENAIILHSGLQPEESASPFYTEAIESLEELESLASDEYDKEEDASLEVFRNLLVQTITIIENINITADYKIDLTEATYCLGAINGGEVDTSEIPSIINSLREDVIAAEDKDGDADGQTLAELKSSNSIVYNQIKKEIESLKVVLPPSSIMAGVYAMVDGLKGVWKAPANVGLNYVISPTEKISDKEQVSLNVDQYGKSINAIRSFTGKGTLVWGGRTFEGDSEDWKYISVRRFFDMVQKSVQNATHKFLYEPNDANTWIRAKAMIENYLNQLWKNGALAGSTPEQAYYVAVGKHTIDPMDIEEGKMTIEIGLAAVRPAEFIVLNFTHRLQQG